MAILPAALFLCILPLTHTIALRLLLLAVTLAAACYVWRSEGAPTLPARGPILVWAALAIASLAWSVDVAYSRGEVTNEIGYAMVAFASFFVLGRSESDLRHVLLGLVASIGLISLYAINNYFTHYFWLVSDSIGVGDRNAYSTTITLIFPALMFVLANARLGVATPLIVWLVLALSLAAGALTQNRMMWIAIGTAVAVFLAFSYSAFLRTRRNRLLAVGIVCLIAGVSVAQIMVITTIRGSGFTAYDRITGMAEQDERPRIWAYALERARERPAFGHGFGRGILRKDFRAAIGGILPWHAHNAFLSKAIELGLAGVAAYCAMLAALGAAFWKLRRASDPLARSLGAFGLALLAAMIVRSLTDDTIVRENALLFWSLAGLALGVGVRRSAPAVSAGSVY